MRRPSLAPGIAPGIAPSDSPEDRPILQWNALPWAAAVTNRGERE